MEKVTEGGKPLSSEQQRIADHVTTARHIAECLHYLRGRLLDLPLAAREQLRIECLSVADACHELTRLQKAEEPA